MLHLNTKKSEGQIQGMRAMGAIAPRQVVIGLFTALFFDVIPFYLLTGCHLRQTSPRQELCDG